MEIYPMLYEPDIQNKRYGLFKGFLQHIWPEEGIVLEETITIYDEELCFSSWHGVG